MSLLIILILITTVIEIIIVVFYTHYRKRYNLILNTETSRITTLKKGFYEIKGKVIPLENMLVCPLSQVPCVYYKFKVEEQRGSGKNSSWHTIIKDEKFVRFGIEDTSGIAYIKSEGAKLIVNKDKKGNTGLFKKASDELETTMKKYGKSTEGWLFDKTLQYEETYLAEGDELYVLGEVAKMEGYYPVFEKGKLPFIVSDKSEETLLKKAKQIFQVALLFMVAIPMGLLVYLFYFLDLL